jgi:hypothetical protein
LTKPGTATPRPANGSVPSHLIGNPTHDALLKLAAELVGYDAVEGEANDLGRTKDVP